MVAAVAAALKPDALASCVREFGKHLRGDRFVARIGDHRRCSVSVGLGLISRRLEASNAVFKRQVVEIGHTSLDGIVEPLEPQIGFSGSLVQLADMVALALGLLLPSVEDSGEDRFEPFGLQQPLFEMIDDQRVELLHRNRHAAAPGRALSRLSRAGIIAITSTLAGADGHGPAALGAMDQARQQRRAAGHPRRGYLGITRLEQSLHRIEHRAVDDRWYRHHHHVARRVELLALAALVELMLADIGFAGEDAVDLTDAPAPAVAGEDAASVEMRDDIFDTHLPAGAVAFDGEAIDQPDGVGVQRVDFELLLDLRAALLGSNGAIADRR